MNKDKQAKIDFLKEYKLLCEKHQLNIQANTYAAYDLGGVYKIDKIKNSFGGDNLGSQIADIQEEENITDLEMEQTKDHGAFYRKLLKRYMLHVFTSESSSLLDVFYDNSDGVVFDDEEEAVLREIEKEVKSML